MLYFPQLLSGAVAQYPLLKRRTGRTILNAYLDGSISRLLDPTASVLEWHLTFSGLTTREREVMENFFQAAEGRLQEFTFLDPTDNLLNWSEQLSSAAWSRDPLLQIIPGVADPSGANRAARIVNQGAISQKLQQTISAPAWFQYCLSVHARSDQGAEVYLFRSTSSVEEGVRERIGPRWRRLGHSRTLAAAEERIAFGIGLEAGAAVEVYGIQVEPQPAPSPYRKTAAQSGVYRNCRFADDVLLITTDGPDMHSCSVRIVAPLTE